MVPEPKSATIPCSANRLPFPVRSRLCTLSVRDLYFICTRSVLYLRVHRTKSVLYLHAICTLSPRTSDFIAAYIGLNPYYIRTIYAICTLSSRTSDFICTRSVLYRRVHRTKSVLYRRVHRAYIRILGRTHPPPLTIPVLYGKCIGTIPALTRH